MTVFADTSGIFAALVRNDANHEPARETLAGLLDDPEATITTTDFVLLETMALLQARVGLDAALKFDRDLRPVLDVTWVDSALYSRAIRRLNLRQRRRVSLVDCISFVTMEEAGLRTAFSYDQHFADEGFDTLGG